MAARGHRFLPPPHEALPLGPDRGCKQVPQLTAPPHPLPTGLILRAFFTFSNNCGFLGKDLNMQMPEESAKVPQSSEIFAF